MTDFRRETVTTSRITSRTATRSNVWRGAALLLAFLSAATQANAVGARSKIACLSDYRAYCSAYGVGSPELRKCMRANGAKLSNQCIRALVADGEISEAEVARRAASMR
jgi:hypothetical protein